MKKYTRTLILTTLSSAFFASCSLSATFQPPSEKKILHATELSLDKKLDQRYKELESSSDKHGKEDFRTAKKMVRVASVLKEMGEFSRAKLQLNKALKINTKHYGEEHPKTVKTMQNLSELELLCNMTVYSEFEVQNNRKHNPGDTILMAEKGYLIRKIADTKLVIEEEEEDDDDDDELDMPGVD